MVTFYSGPQGRCKKRIIVAQWSDDGVCAQA